MGQQRRRYIQLFLIFLLLLPFLGCNLFISLIDEAKQTPIPYIPPQSTPQPTESPPIVITGLTEVGIIDTGDACVVVENGDYLYTAGWNGEPDNFCVVDFSDPTEPLIMGRVSVGSAYGVTTSGQYAYVETDGGGGSPSSGVLAINCTNPSSPGIADIETQGYDLAYQIYYNNGYIYNPSRSMVSIYDASNPADIIYLYALTAVEAAWAGIQDNYLYFTDCTYPGKMEVYDISTPYEPVLTADFETSSYNPNGIAVDGDYAFLNFDDGSCSVSAVDISNPASPQEISSVSLNSGISNYFTEMKVDDGYLFVCGEDDFYVIDVHDPYNMIEITSIRTSYEHCSWGFTISGDYAIVSDNTLYRVIQIERGTPEPSPEPTPAHVITNWSFDDPDYTDYTGTYSAGETVLDDIPAWQLAIGAGFDSTYNIGINTGNDPEAQSNYLYLGQENTSNELPVVMSASQNINFPITSSSRFKIRFKILNYATASGSEHGMLEYPVRISAGVAGGTYKFYLRSNLIASGEESAALNTWIEDEIVLEGRTAYGAKSATHVIQVGDIFTNIKIEPFGNYFGVYFEYLDFFD